MVANQLPKSHTRFVLAGCARRFVVVARCKKSQSEPAPTVLATAIPPPSSAVGHDEPVGHRSKPGATNTNGLLRQYMPKGMDLSGLSQLQLNAIARQLNEGPRKTLGFHTPAEMFSECVALIG